MSTAYIQHYPADQARIVLGMISGTSADGIDVARVRFPAANEQGKLELLDFKTFPYEPEMKSRIMAAAGDKLSLRETAVLHTELGEVFAQAALKVIGDKDCDLVGSHGQTVCHLPEQNTTLQLGDPSIIAHRTKTLTVGDFRTADMALGGQGAPLVPLFDQYLLSSPKDHRIAVNLGGIANITVVPSEESGQPVRAWDTGPANCLSDALCRIAGKGQYDPGGEWAAEGSVNDELLRKLLTEDYFKLDPPKSTGLEDFGEDFCRQHFPSGNLCDNLRTSLALSAQTLVDSIFSSYSSGDLEIVFAGGGTSNLTLMTEIERRLREGTNNSVKVSRFSEFGVPEDAREAVAFAFLGDRTARGLVGTVPSTTGATAPAILGKVCFPSP